MLIINDTSPFYTSENPSLMWEMTICQSLSRSDNVVTSALTNPRAYGAILAAFIAERGPSADFSHIVEIGGGYGTLMSNLLLTVRAKLVTMVDISPRFLKMQAEALEGMVNVQTVQLDAVRFLNGFQGCCDLLIANENIGDFTTVDGLDAAKLRERAVAGAPFDESEFDRCARFARHYKLELPPHGAVAMNLGALEFVEALSGKAKIAFISEHSADISPDPRYDFLQPLATGQPRRIELKDHAEYSIRFDHLEAVARASGFTVERISMLEFLAVRDDKGARFMAGAECVGNEKVEAIHEFINHAKEYECLLLVAKEAARSFAEKPRISSD